MTKETKIGLLVGLAFIILFAVILSEKGPPQRTPTSPNFTAADDGRAIEAGGGDQASLQNTGHLPIGGGAPGPTVGPTPSPSEGMQGPLTEEFVAQVGSSDTEQLPPLSPDLIAQLNGTVRAPGDAGSTADGAPIEASPIMPPSVDAPRSTIASAQPGREPRIPMAQPVEPRPSSTTPAVAAGSANPPVVLTVHTVAAGESLGKIAARHYGRSTPERIKAIYDANKDVIKDVHRVRENDKLKIPKLVEAFPGAFEPVTTLSPPAISGAPSPRSTGPEPRIPPPVTERSTSLATRGGERPTTQERRETEPAGYRLYEVRPGDTLSSIARRQLGDERRYRELQRLNRDAIPNVNALKPGAKIRLPRDGGAAPSAALSVANTIQASQ